MGPVDREEPLARLLAMTLSAIVEELHQRLEERGWGETRPLWGFVLLSLRDRSRNIAEVGELLGVTKQAAAKVIDGLSGAGLVHRAADPADRRATALTLTARGGRFLADVESAYEAIEGSWAAAVGERRLASLRTALSEVLDARYGGQRPPLRPAL